jgi:PAS domain S-box-containing protein
MDRPYELPPSQELLREKIIGLGERSIRKSYYPELQERLSDLERFKTLLDHCRDVILLADAATGRLLDANNAIARDWGYECAGLKALALGELFPPETWEIIQQSLAREEAEQTPQVLLTWVRTRPGEWIPTEITLSQVRNGQSIYAVIVARDDSERRQMEQALRASEELYRGLFDAVPQILWSCRPDGTAELYNYHWFDYTGWQPEKDGHREWLEALATVDAPRLRENWQAALAGQTELECEVRLTRGSDGMERWYLIRIAPVLTGHGQVLKWIGAALDVHDRILAEKTIQEESRRKDEFLAMLAHELRNPLAPIMNAIGILSLVCQQEPCCHRQQVVIKRQLSHMSRLVDDLLDVSRIRQGRISLKKERLDLREVLDRTVEAMPAWCRNTS